MQKFFIKTILFLIPLFLMTKALEYGIDTGLRHSHIENAEEWNAIFEKKVHANLLIQGTSRAWRHISPRIIDSVLGVESLNLGMDGYGFAMQYHRLQMLLQNNPEPKYIIQSIESSEWRRRNDLYMRGQFIPFLNQPLMREAVKGYEGEFSWLDYHVPLLKYRDESARAQLGLFYYLGWAKDFSWRYKGYAGIEKPWDSAFSRFKNSFPRGMSDSIDQQTKNDFTKFLQDCREKKIAVVLVYTPEYIEGQRLHLNRDSIITLFHGIANQYEAKFLDYSQDTICLHKEYFTNSLHLNKTGSEIFTVKLAEDLKTKLHWGL